MFPITPVAQPEVELAFTSLNSEVEIDSLPVEGEIPHWLNGCLYRNGPAKFEIGQASYNHWFDGLAMVHRYAFHEGQIAYRNRFLHSEKLIADRVLVPFDRSDGKPEHDIQETDETNFTVRNPMIHLARIKSECHNAS